MRYFYVIVQILALHIKVCFLFNPNPLVFVNVVDTNSFVVLALLISDTGRFLYFVLFFCILYFYETFQRTHRADHPSNKTNSTCMATTTTHIQLQCACHVTSFTLYFHVFLFCLFRGWIFYCIERTLIQWLSRVQN